jgi:release factor glutamine methyltransferase
VVACTENKVWTVLDLLNWTAAHFRRAEIENPRLNAELLLGHVLKTERIMLYARFDEAVAETARDEFRALVRRRAAREPLQHMLGAWEFYGRTFEVGPAALVPRSETETLVERCLTLLPEDGVEHWVADIGTGSGVVAATLAAERPALRVVATDISDEALALAARNAAALGVADRMQFAQGDLAEPVRLLLPDGCPGLSLLASNPPYVCTDEIAGLEPEVSSYDPHAALDGGADGLDLVRRLVPQAAALLVGGGWLVLELDPRQMDEAGRITAAAGFDAETIQVSEDGAGRPRVLSVRMEN